MDGIAIPRLQREMPETLPVVVRPAGRQQPTLAQPGTGGYFTRDRHRTLELEISLNDFGLEESYGRFIREKVYAVSASDLRGSLIDLYV